MREIKLPIKHAQDWASRCMEDDGSEVIAQTARTITFRLTDAMLRDLISDADHYAFDMGPDETGDIDYRPPARTCLKAIRRAGIDFTVKNSQVTIKEESQ